MKTSLLFVSFSSIAFALTKSPPMSKPLTLKQITHDLDVCGIKFPKNKVLYTPIYSGCYQKCEEKQPGTGVREKTVATAACQEKCQFSPQEAYFLDRQNSCKKACGKTFPAPKGQFLSLHSKYCFKRCGTVISTPKPKPTTLIPMTPKPASTKPPAPKPKPAYDPNPRNPTKEEINRLLANCGIPFPKNKVYTTPKFTACYKGCVKKADGASAGFRSLTQQESDCQQNCNFSPEEEKILDMQSSCANSCYKKFPALSGQYISVTGNACAQQCGKVVSS